VDGLCRVMAKASVAMHSKFKKAQKDQAQVTLTLTLMQTLTCSNLLHLLWVRRKLVEHDGLAHQRHVKAMDRMAYKHGREVQMVLDKDRVEKGGELRQQARIARQATAELGKVKQEKIELKERLELMATEHNDMPKTLVRERRLHDVERQKMYYIPSPRPFPNPLCPVAYVTLCPFVISRVTKCDNLKATVTLRDMQDEAKKRRHSVAMAKANTIKLALDTKMKALTKEEGQWRWKRYKQARNLEVEKQTLQAKHVDVQLAGKRIDRKTIALRQGCAALEREASALVKAGAKHVADKKVLRHNQL
jgi:hypothetical protein